MNFDYITETLARLATSSLLPVSLSITCDSSVCPRFTASLVCAPYALESLDLPPLTASAADADTAIALLNEMCRAHSPQPEPTAADVSWRLLGHCDLTPENGWTPEHAEAIWLASNLLF